MTDPGSGFGNASAAAQLSALSLSPIQGADHEIPNDAKHVAAFVRKLRKRHVAPEFVYEAGPCGYGLYRQLTDMGCDCRIVAPSRTPKAPGERIKNDARDAEKLARLARAGELTYVWVPDPLHEAICVICVSIRCAPSRKTVSSGSSETVDPGLGNATTSSSSMAYPFGWLVTPMDTPPHESKHQIRL